MDEDRLNDVRKMQLLNDEKVVIEIILDKLSLGFFINGLSTSFLIYPNHDSTEFELTINADNYIAHKSVFL